MANVKRAVARPLPRDLYIACMARAVSVLGTELSFTALVLQLHDTGAGAWAVAGVFLAGTLPLVVLAPVAGLVADRFDSRTVIVTASLWQAAICAVLAFVGTPSAVLILVALESAGAASVGPTFGALIPLMAPPERLARAASLQQSTNMIAVLAGPTLGGVLTGLTGSARVPLLIDAATFIAITAAGLLITTRRRRDPTGSSPRMRAGIVALVNDPVLAGVTALLALMVLVGQVVSVAEVFLVRDTFHAGAIVYGALTAIYTFGTLIGTAGAGWLDTPRRILVAIPVASVAMAAGIAGVGLSGGLLGAYICYLVAGLGVGVTSVAVSTLLMLRTPQHLMGRVQASFNGVLQACAVGSLGLGGLLTGILRPEIVYLLAGAAAMIAVLVTAPTMRRALAST